MYKPEKSSNTITEGGSAEFECKLLFGDNIQAESWSWVRNNETIVANENIKIESNTELTKITIEKIKPEDKGTYMCQVKNDYGVYSEHSSMAFFGYCC